MQILSLLSIFNFILPLVWLGAILIYWAKNSEVNLKWVKCGILTVIALFVMSGAYSTVATYNLWKNDPVSRYLLPLYSGAYFYQYAFFHFWRSYAIILSIGLIWVGVLWLLYKYSRGRILGKTEIALGFFTALIAGWPNFIAYLGIIFGLMLIQGAINIFILKNKNSVAIAGSMILSAFIVAGWGDFFVKMPFLENLKI